MMILDVVTVLCIGLLIGTEFAVSAFINPILERLGEAPRAQATAMFGRRLGFAMPFWYSGSLALLIAETVVRWHVAGDGWLIGACAIWVAVIVVTLAVLVPINNRLTKLDGTAFPAEAQQQHRKWDNLHRVRVAALAAATVCLLVAVGV